MINNQEEEEKKEKKKAGNPNALIYESILLIFILLVSIFGVSFAVVKYTQTGEESNTIRTGELRMSYTEDTNGIKIENAMPMSDDIGKKLSGNNEFFDFTVSTTIRGNATLAYEVSAEKSLDSTLRDDEVKLYLEKKAGAIYETVMNPVVFTPLKEKTKWGTEKGTMLLTTGTSTHTENISYRLRMWVKQDAIMTGEERIFSVRVNLKGGVVVE